MKVCREHGIRVTAALKTQPSVRVDARRVEVIPVGYLCPVSPARILREDEVIDPDD